MPYPYTMETLRSFASNRVRSLLQFDVEKVNRLCEAIAAMRRGDPVPTDGDMIICMNPTGKQESDRGYLERRENLLMVCSHPSSVHLDEHQNGQIYSTAGGGPWTGYMREEQFLEQAEYVGKVMATFWTWGMRDAIGGISFQAEVSLWRFTSRTEF